MIRAFVFYAPISPPPLWPLQAFEGLASIYACQVAAVLAKSARRALGVCRGIIRTLLLGLH